MIIHIMIALFVILIGIYAITLYRDVFLHINEFKAEKGNGLVIAVLTAGIQFFSTMGISDFNLSIPIYRGARLVDDKRLPGTLVTASAIPGVLVSIIYISAFDISWVTLIGCLSAQVLGTVVGRRIVTRMNAAAMRRVMATALIVSTIVVLSKIIGFGPGEGTLTGLPTWVVACIVPVFFIFGIINMMGFGVKALSMSLLMALGLTPVNVLLIVLSSCGISSWCGAMQYVKSGLYQRKIAAISSVAGILGVIVGSFLVKSLNTTVLQWIMVAVMIHAAVTMLAKDKKA